MVLEKWALRPTSIDAMREGMFIASKQGAVLILTISANDKLGNTVVATAEDDAADEAEEVIPKRAEGNMVDLYLERKSIY